MVRIAFPVSFFQILSNTMPHFPSVRVPCLSAPLLAIACVCGVVLTGCRSKATAPPVVTSPAAAPVAPPSRQERAVLMQRLHTMTPEQRSAYLKSHPEALSLLNR